MLSAATLILVVTVGVSLLAFRNPELLDRLMLHPDRVYYDRAWYEMLTSGFVHGSLGHLGLNMLTFFFFAYTLEEYLGTLPMLVLYLGSIVLANVSTVFEHRDDPDYASLGASGGVSALVFSLILFEPGMKLYLFFIPIGIPAIVYAIGFVVYSYFAGSRQTGINHKAHLWGALSGILFTVLLSPEIRDELLSGIHGLTAP